MYDLNYLAFFTECKNFSQQRKQRDKRLYHTLQAQKARESATEKKPAEQCPMAEKPVPSI